MQTRSGGLIDLLLLVDAVGAGAHVHQEEEAAAVGEAHLSVSGLGGVGGEKRGWESRKDRNEGWQKKRRRGNLHNG